MPRTDTDGSASALRARLEMFVGRPLGGDGPTPAPDPVNQPMIRHWAAAFEDTNPVYTDPERAAGSRFGGIVSPPAMLQTWTMATPLITGIRERGGSPAAAAPCATLPGPRAPGATRSYGTPSTRPGGAPSTAS